MTKQHLLPLLSLCMVTMVAMGQEFRLSEPVISSESNARQLAYFTPGGCGGSDYCEDTPDYPDEEIIRDIVGKLGRDNLVTHIFFNNTLDNNQTAVVDKILTDYDTAEIAYSDYDPLTLRGNFETTDEFDLVRETPLCHFIESFVFPKTAKTRSNQWR